MQVAGLSWQGVHGLRIRPLGAEVAVRPLCSSSCGPPHELTRPHVVPEKEGALMVAAIEAESRNQFWSCSGFGLV